jgi:hypothetical protein
LFLFCLQEFRRNAFNTDSVDEALDLLDFCYKIVSRSGLSENGTYLPKAIHPKYSCVHVSNVAGAAAFTEAQQSAALPAGPATCTGREWLVWCTNDGVSLLRPATCHPASCCSLQQLFVLSASFCCLTCCLQPKTSIDDAMEEARMVMCGAIEGLLKKQGEQSAEQCRS